MPRFRVKNPVSIPDSPPVCPRCLDVEPGVPSGDLSIANPSAEDLCVSCSLACAENLIKERGPLAKHTLKITERLAPHAVASRPLQPWPRPGMPDIPDGPSRLALGPRDFEGLGRERFWDQFPEERAKALPAMVEDANINCAARVDVRYLGVVSENKAFAKGWLNELQRVGGYKNRDRKK